MSVIDLPEIDNPVMTGAPVVRKPLPDVSMYRAMRAGHLRRHGHALCAELVSEDGGELYRGLCAKSKLTPDLSGDLTPSD